MKDLWMGTPELLIILAVICYLRPKNLPKLVQCLARP